MLRFNFYVPLQKQSFYIISIHLMLRFNFNPSTGSYLRTAFQYILCYGSTFFCTAFYRGRKHFNTSYVTVQLIPTHNKNPPKNISIHLMLRFNNSKYLRIIPKYKISIHLMLRFNTDISPVFCNFFKFQYILCYGSTPCLNQYKILIAIFQYILCYGSTPWLPYPQHFLRQFQYILCYGSTMPKTTNAKDKTAFQYILCYGSTIRGARGESR